MAKKEEIKFALEFPQGRILCMKPEYNNQELGGVYFLPADGAEAFMVWGERKELFGKNAICVRQDETTPNAYNVVYEFSEKGALLDARLVTKDKTVQGVLADPSVVAVLNEDIKQGQVTLMDRSDIDRSRATVSRVARLEDGRSLVLIGGRDELYLGKPGNYEKLDAQCVLVGGGSRYYKLATGESIALPSPGGREPPMFKGEELAYLNLRGDEAPEKFGLTLPAAIQPLNPFSPELDAPKTSAPRKSATNLRPKQG